MTKTKIRSLRDMVNHLRAEGYTVEQVAHECCVSRQHLYNLMADTVPLPFTRTCIVRGLATLLKSSQKAIVDSLPPEWFVI